MDVRPTEASAIPRLPVDPQAHKGLGSAALHFAWVAGTACSRPQHEDWVPRPPNIADARPSDDSGGQAGFVRVECAAECGNTSRCCRSRTTPVNSCLFGPDCALVSDVMIRSQVSAHVAAFLYASTCLPCISMTLDSQISRPSPIQVNMHALLHPVGHRVC